MTIALIILLAIAFVAAALKAAGYSNRCANLEYLLHMEREITTELGTQLQREHALCAEYVAGLDDATRTAAHWQERHDALLKENSTLSVDLFRTEQQLQAYCTHYRRWRNVSAGAVMLSWIAVSGQAVKEGNVP